MKTRPIDDPLDGEQVVAVDPKPQRLVDAGWRRRLNLFTGRSLTHSALAAEQAQRAGRLAMLGQAISPGVVSGLEIGVEPGAGDPTAGQVHLAPGLGITAAGEEVFIGRALRLAVRDLRLYGLAAEELPAGVSAPEKAGLLGPSIGRLLDAGGSVPRAGLLLLQPVIGEQIGDFDASDPCPRDPESEAFEDQQLIDGCRVFLHVWPRQIPLPPPGPQWRNRLAYALFERERRLAPGERMPWAETGLAVALVGFDARGAVEFVDRHAVARAGGEPPGRSAPLAGAVSRFLHTARILQFAEHLGDLLDSGADLTSATAHFRRLPPAGVLPPGLLDLGTFRQTFLPAQFSIAALPAPVEQLEEVLLESAGLEPFSLVPGAEQSQVEMLVGVPQEFYEPRLLETESVDLEFQQTLDGFIRTRGGWLARRGDLRAKNDLLRRGLTAEAPSYPDDSDAETGEAPAVGPLDPGEDEYGTELVDSTRRVTELEALRGFLAGNTVLARELAARDDGPSDRLAELGLDGFIDHLDKQVRRADDKIDVGFLRVQTDIYRLRQLMLGSEASARLATSPVLASIAQGESAYATRKDLETFIQRIRKGKPVTGGGGAGEDGGEGSGGGGLGGGPRPPRPTGTVSAAAGGTFFAGDMFVARELEAPTRASRESRAPDLSRASRPVDEVAAPSSSRGEIVGQSSIVGQAYDFRTLTISERLRQPPANEAKAGSVSSKFEVVSGFLDGQLDTMVSDLAVPGFIITTGDAPQEVSRTFADIRKDKLDAEILSGKHDPDPPDGDEAGFFSNAVRAADHSVAILRRVEGRVGTYRRGVVRCRQTRDAMRTSLAALADRLGVVDKKLAEARHDVAVGRALLAEESHRIQAINQRRQRVLDEHAELIAFRRPRFARPLRSVPSRQLDPAATEGTVPSCLARPIEVPEEIREMVELFRESPLGWHRDSPRLLDRLDRLEVLRGALRGARTRAASRSLASPAVATVAPAGRGRLARGVQTALATHRQVLTQHRRATARLDLVRVERESWRDSRRRAETALSLGDLMDLSHGRSDVSRRAARELDQMAQVATCLYAGFGEVLPSVRLDWAERLSQFDSPIDLRDLANLPRWDEIDVPERRHMQKLADWLFGRVRRRESEAVAMMSDLVRVCLLLASHAPVGRIVSGTVTEAVTVRPGGRVPLAVEPGSVRIGMQVLLFAGVQTVARGVVEDLTGGRAVARMVHAFQENARVAKDSRVQFAEARAFQLAGAVPRAHVRASR